MKTKTLASEPLQSVSVYGARSATLRDRKTDARVTAIVRPRHNNVTRRSVASGLGEYATKLRRAPQSTLGRKTEVSFVAPWLDERTQGMSLTRPFARRALKTLRPFLVADRARKPWTRARLSRLG